MNKIELQKKANKIRQGIVASVHSAKPVIQEVLYQRLTYLHIFIFVELKILILRIPKA